MKPKWQHEVLELAASPELREWWEELQRTRAEEDSAREQHDELLTQINLLEFRSDLAQRNASDMLFQAGEYEDAAAKALAEMSAMDNRSFRIVGDFEDLRLRVSNLWYELGSKEETVRELQEEIEALSAKGGSSSSEAKKKEAELKAARRDLEVASAAYDKEASRKTKLWAEVEGIWNKSLRINLAVAERRRKAAKVRGMAERLFAQVESNKDRTNKLRAESQRVLEQKNNLTKRLHSMLDAAGERFDCIAGEDFLYWPQREDPRRVYCLALVTDADAYPSPVSPLQVYQSERTSGVDTLTALPETPQVAGEYDPSFSV